MIALLAAAVVAFILILWCIGTYRGLLLLRSQYRATFAQLENLFKRRCALVSEFISVVEPVMTNESEKIAELIKTCSAATQVQQTLEGGCTVSSELQRLSKSEFDLSVSIAWISSQAKKYSGLLEDAKFVSLKKELSTLEIDIAFARQTYNDTVKLFRRHRAMFPGAVIAEIAAIEAAYLVEDDFVSETQQ